VTLSGLLGRPWRQTPAGRDYGRLARDLAESVAARAGLTADATADVTADPVIEEAAARLAALAHRQEALERAIRLGERVRP
jgi:hypothetical protein